MLKQLKYVDVILPLSVEGTFQYSVEDNIDIIVGQRVIVQFGSRKLYTAIVIKISNKKNNRYKIKEIQSIINEPPIVNQFQINLWLWISKYYMCCIGEVMNTALPSSLKLASESKLMLSPELNNNFSSFSEDISSVLNLISKSRLLSIHDLNKQLENKLSFSIINSLIKENVLIVHEHLNDKYKSRLIAKVSLTNNNFKDIHKLTPKQEFLLDKLFEFSKNNYNDFTLASLIKNTGFSRSIFKSLENKSLIKINYEKQSRLNIQDVKTYPIHKLSNAQELSFNSINKKFLNNDVCLLHGVTSSDMGYFAWNHVVYLISLSVSYLYFRPRKTVLFTNQNLKPVSSAEVAIGFLLMLFISLYQVVIPALFGDTPPYIIKQLNIWTEYLI